MDTTRRDFLIRGCCAAGGLLASGGAACVLGVAGCALPWPAERRTVRFGVIADSHYSTRARWGGRHYSDSLAKMRQAVDAFNAGGLDFAIELGDLKDMGVKPDRAEALGFLDAIEAEFARFAGPRYHVLGNHDMDCVSKQDFLSHTENHGAAKGRQFYSFVVGGVKLVVLDACFKEDLTPYQCGNFNWRKAFLPDEELAWLDVELKAATMPVVVFCHQLLDGFSRAKGLGGVFVGNWKCAVDIMEKSGNVLASIQGHHHEGHYSFRNGIHYWTMKAMISGAYPQHNSYAVVDVSPEGNVSIKGFGDCENRLLVKGVECRA